MTQTIRRAARRHRFVIVDQAAVGLRFGPQRDPLVERFVGWRVDDPEYAEAVVRQQAVRRLTC